MSLLDDPLISDPLSDTEKSPTDDPALTDVETNFKAPRSPIVNTEPAPAPPADLS